MIPSDARRMHTQAARVVVALARLVELERQTPRPVTDVEHQSAYAADAVRQFCLLSPRPLHVTFTAGIPFLRRTPLWAAPWVFERLEPLAFALHAHGWSDLRIEQTVRPGDLVALASRIASDPDDQLPPKIPNVALGDESFADLASVLHVDETVPGTTLGTAYAAVVATLWETRSAAQRGEAPDLVRLQRSAQLVVDLAATRRFAATSPTSARIGGDGCARSVDATILAVEMRLAAGAERRRLSEIALAGLLLGLAPFDERGAAIADGPPSLGRGGRMTSASRLAARTLGLTMLIPRLAQAQRAAATLVYEAQLRRYRWLSDESRGSAGMDAVVLATAVRFLELLGKSPGPLEGVFRDLSLEAHDGRDELALRMLCAALGVVPPGSVLELRTGAIVVQRCTIREGIPSELIAEEVESGDAVRADSVAGRVAVLHGFRLGGRAPKRGERSVEEPQREPRSDRPKVRKSERPSSLPRREPLTRPSSPRLEAVELGPEILSGIVSDDDD